MKDPAYWFLCLVIAVNINIQISQASCLNQPSCDERHLEKFTVSVPIREPKYYWSPGPITLSCLAFGDVQSIYWIRKQFDGDEVEIHNAKTFNGRTTNSTSFLNSTITNYLLPENFPYTYQCIALDKCCKRQKSKPRKVELSPCRFQSDKCIKDILVIIDMSASVGRFMFKDKIKPFLYRLFADNTLDVSPNGSNFAIMAFSTPNKTKLLVSFDNGVHQKSLIETVQRLNYRRWYGPQTRTDLALQLANQIFSEKSPINHRPGIDDIILLVTDGEPVAYGRSEFTVVDDTLVEADKLKAKGVRIVGVRIARVYVDLTVLKQIATDGQTLETTFDDIGNTIDKIVEGFCPQTTTVPNEPKNVKVSVQKNTIKASWSSQKEKKNEYECYVIYWKRIRNDSSENFNANITTSPSVLIHTTDGPGTYIVEVHSANRVGIGKAAYVHNVQVLATPESGTSSSPESATPSSPESGNISSPDSGKKPGASDDAVIGGVLGSILFLVLAVIVFTFLRNFARKRREQSVQEFQSRHERQGRKSDPVTSPLFRMEQLNKEKKSDEQEELSYVELLKDWEISPTHLKLTDKKLGSGQFGIVKQGFYTPKNSASEIVAVKMLKDNARETNFSDLLAEIELLKKVNKEPHPNVIKFIGGCSLQGKLLVVTEFCPGGNLRNFLRSSRVDYQNLTSSSNDRQLLKIALDVVSGMVHLSHHKFIHRDLAARNILLGEGNLAKVSDFGLARDIENAEEYIRSNQNLLPVKWMALECLLHGRFTTASDVWSFGILLYEIVTLGEEPYKNISSYNIITHVGAGGRMSKPSHCSDEINLTSISSK